MDSRDCLNLQKSDSQVTIGTLSHTDKLSIQPEGLVTVIASGIGADGIEYQDDILYQAKPNLILDGARDIIRDVMMGENGITKISFGDLGKDTDASLSELINVDAPLETDTALVRKVGDKSFVAENIVPIGRGTSDSSTDRPGIRYTIVLEEEELVPEDEDSQFILEMALVKEVKDEDGNVTDVLFSRKTHPVIIKTKDLRLTFIWEILF